MGIGGLVVWNDSIDLISPNIIADTLIHTSGNESISRTKCPPNLLFLFLIVHVLPGRIYTNLKNVVNYVETHEHGLIADEELRELD